MKLTHWLCILGIMFFVACKQEESSSDDSSSDNTDGETDTGTETTDDGSTLESNPGTLAVGGLPSSAELEDLDEITEEEANLAAKDLESSNESLPLNLQIDTEGVAGLMDGAKDPCRHKSEEEKANGEDDEGIDGMYCLGKLFGDLYDQVVKAAGCNFKLLSRTPNGDLKTFRKVDGLPVYFVDGFGTIGMGDEGKLFCPDHKRVYGWAKKIGLPLPGAEQGDDSQVTDDEFYFPTRLVIFKSKNGKFGWRVIFFPADYIEALSSVIPPFKNILDRDMDFVVYKGVHASGSEIGKGVGATTIDWTELGRMITTLDDLGDDDEPQDGKDDDGPPPSGTIAVTYNTNDVPNKFTTLFSKGFSFEPGKEDDNPFHDGSIVHVQKHAGENFMLFRTANSFIEPDPNKPDDDGGPLTTIRRCTNPDYGQEDQAPWLETKIQDIAKEDYLKIESKSYLQMIWKDVPAGKFTPDDYLVQISNTKGGPYLYGPVVLQAGKKSGSRINFIRQKAPVCDALTPEKIAEYNEVLANHLGEPTATYLDEDNFQNLVFEGNPEDGNGIKLVPKDQVIQYLPVFDNFQLIGSAFDKPSPLKK